MYLWDVGVPGQAGSDQKPWPREDGVSECWMAGPVGSHGSKSFDLTQAADC